MNALKGVPRLRELDLTGCGLLDEDVRDLQISKPELKIKRQ